MNRDLDARIVKEIFNWRYIKVGPDYHGNNACEVLFDPNIKPTQDYYDGLPKSGKPHEGFFAPAYSGDLKQALQLAIHVKLPIPICDLSLDPENIATMALIYFHKPNKQPPSVDVKPLIAEWEKERTYLIEHRSEVLAGAYHLMLSVYNKILTGLKQLSSNK